MSEQLQPSTAPVEKLAYTIDEAVAASTISRAKIYRLISSGRLASRKIGARTIIPASSLRNLIEHGEAA